MFAKRKQLLCAIHVTMEYPPGIHCRLTRYRPTLHSSYYNVMAISCKYSINSNLNRLPHVEYFVVGKYQIGTRETVTS